jgi:hypothetical protein
MAPKPKPKQERGKITVQQPDGTKITIEGTTDQVREGIAKLLRDMKADRGAPKFWPPTPHMHGREPLIS